MSFFRWLRWLWATRNCIHPVVRGIHGDERQTYGYRWRCVECDKVLHDKPEAATVR